MGNPQPPILDSRSSIFRTEQWHDLRLVTIWRSPNNVWWTNQNQKRYTGRPTAGFVETFDLFVIKAVDSLVKFTYNVKVTDRPF